MASVKIAAEPFAVDLDLDETALVVIDMQKDFLEPGIFWNRVVLAILWATM
jgi:hypothetical protein